MDVRVVVRRREEVCLAGIPPIDFVTDILQRDGLRIAEIIGSPCLAVRTVFQRRRRALAFYFHTDCSSGFHSLECQAVIGVDSGYGSRTRRNRGRARVISILPTACRLHQRGKSRNNQRQAFHSVIIK